MKGITKKIFFNFCSVLTKFKLNIPKIIFGHMSCAKRYNLGQDSPNLTNLSQLLNEKYHILKMSQEEIQGLKRLKLTFFKDFLDMAPPSGFHRIGPSGQKKKLELNLSFFGVCEHRRTRSASAKISKITYPVNNETNQ